MPALGRREYSAAHRKQRAHLLPYAIGTACPICGRTMYDDQALDLDHSTPVALGGGPVGDRITHASCNRAAGADLGRLMQRPRASRDW